MSTTARTNRRALNRRVEKYIKFSLTNAQILALNGTPITVLPAAPTGFIHLIERIFVTKAAGTAYTIGSNAGIDFKYTNSSGNVVVTTLPTTGFLDQTTASSASADAAATILTLGAAVVANSKTADVTGTGAPGITGRIYFRTIPLSM